ncbi:protoporphyrinogen oxidase HemJ [Alkalinema sp. FACHB-956]|uniref:protoporphyrinogen oxidase HemJ n=1 Tax=Alkalinema sp. FACHB-956 TaxID=2692768 RepID=UPI0016825B04|nr:protoporphyrinogen oxidase HemJ [Alkalinema sp. FACHB-956]MBD2329276.1 protoporphyrinogen oxidase HemJ [Alkalinema sp. FACHB-956]
MPYFWFKAFHIVGFVSWFAGLFYLPRLFVYHAEAQEQQTEPVRSILREQYTLMEKRLYGIIMMPAMIVTIAMAIGMLVVQPDFLHQTWLHVKIALVGVLVVFHFFCRRVIAQLEAGETPLTSKQFRWMNEFPTFFLVVVVMLAVFKNDIPTNATGYVILLMVVAFAASIQLYARKRRLDAEKKKQALEQQVTTESTPEPTA